LQVRVAPRGARTGRGADMGDLLGGESADNADSADNA
jgi:hypothetical protein